MKLVIQDDVYTVEVSGKTANESNTHDSLH